jgi:hypothetical protein
MSPAYRRLFFQARSPGLRAVRPSMIAVPFMGTINPFCANYSGVNVQSMISILSLTSMIENLSVFFKKPAPVPLTFRERTVASFLIGALVFLMIVFFRPAQVNPLPLAENLAAAATYGFISFGISLFSQLFIQKFFMKKGFTRLRLLAWLGITLLEIGTANAFASVLIFGNPPGPGLYFQILGGTFATGIVILALLLLWQRNVRLRGILRQRVVLEDGEICIPADGLEEGWTLGKNRLIYIKALENYVELFYMDKNGRIAHRLIRSTMKKVEAALKPHREFLRCHRSYIVNTDKIESLHGSDGKRSLQMQRVEQIIPVSRGSLRRVKELMRRL